MKNKVDNNNNSIWEIVEAIYQWLKATAKKTFFFSRFEVKADIVTPYGWKFVNYSVSIEENPVHEWLNKGVSFLAEKASCDITLSKRIVDAFVPALAFDGVIGLVEDIYMLTTLSLTPFFHDQQYPFTTDSLDQYLYNKPLYRDFVFEVEENRALCKDGENKETQTEKLQNAFSVYKAKVFCKGIAKRLWLVFEKSVTIIGKKLLERPFMTMLVFSLATITYLAVVAHFYLHANFIETDKHEISHQTHRTALKAAEKRLRSKRQALFLSSGAEKEILADEQLLRNLQQLACFGERREIGQDIEYLNSLKNRPNKLVLGLFRGYFAAPDGQKAAELAILRGLDYTDIICKAIENIERKHSPFALILKQIRASFWSYCKDYKKNVGLLLLVSALHLLLSTIGVPFMTIWLVVLAIALCPLIADPINAFVDKLIVRAYVTVFRPLRQVIGGFDWLMEVKYDNEFEMKQKDQKAKGLLELVNATNDITILPKDLRPGVIAGTIFDTPKEI